MLGHLVFDHPEEWNMDMINQVVDANGLHDFVTSADSEVESGEEGDDESEEAQDEQVLPVGSSLKLSFAPAPPSDAAPLGRKKFWERKLLRKASSSSHA